MQQGFDPPRAFPTGICEIGSWPQTNFLVTLSRLPDSVQFLGEVRTRQRHAAYLGGLGREASLPRIRVCSGGHHLLGIRGLKS